MIVASTAGDTTTAHNPGENTSTTARYPMSRVA